MEEMEWHYNYRTLKQKLMTAKSVKENTGMSMSMARIKLEQLSDLEILNESASEINAEYGYLGHSIVPYYSTERLRKELYPPTVIPYVSIPCSCGEICTNACLPF